MPPSEINFPDPNEQTSYQYVYNGITQNWVWGRTIEVDGALGPSAWVPQAFNPNPLFKIIKITGVDSQVANVARWVYDYEEQYPNFGPLGTAQNLYEAGNTSNKAYGFSVDNNQQLVNNPGFYVRRVPNDTITCMIPTGYAGGEWFMAPNPVTGSCE